MFEFHRHDYMTFCWQRREEKGSEFYIRHEYEIKITVDVCCIFTCMKNDLFTCKSDYYVMLYTASGINERKSTSVC